MQLFFEKRKTFTVFLLFTIAFSAFFFKSNSKTAVVERQKTSMGTVLRASLSKQDEVQIQLIFDRVDQIENSLSSYIKKSEVSLLNKNKYLDNPSSLLRKILQKSQDYHQETLGLFNITLGYWNNEVYEMKKWHHSTDVNQLRRIRSKLKKADKNFNSQFSIQISKDKISLPENIALDLGGVGKGFAIEEAVSSLSSKSSYAFIQLSGDVFCLHRCVFSIRRPEKESKNSLIDLKAKIKKLSISTSGNYEKRISKDIHHLINPYTLKPSVYFSSVTLVGENQNSRLDALATGIASGDLEQARQILKNKAIGAFLITEDRQIYINSYFYKLVSVLDWKGIKKEFTIIALDKK